MNANDAVALATSLVEARFKARAAGRDVADDGTCNFDTVVLGVPRCSKALDLVFEAAAVKAYRERGGYRIQGISEGQAARRTKMVEVFAAHLRSKGFDAHVRYVMD